MLSFVGHDNEHPLGVSVENADKRAKQIAKPLENALNELSLRMAEGHVMMNGTDFQSGAILASFLVQTSTAAIAFLMEKGLINKRLPKAAGEGVETGDKGYL